MPPTIALRHKGHKLKAPSVGTAKRVAKLSQQKPVAKKKLAKQLHAAKRKEKLATAAAEKAAAALKHSVLHSSLNLH